jgi:DNA replication and repair protein RecF
VIATAHMALSRLSLTDFRNHAALDFRPAANFVVLHGSNGAGKTNILEAVSLLVPGQGLRRAALVDMVRNNGTGGFSIAAEIGDVVLGTGVDASAPQRRKVRINNANASINSLAEWLSIIWLTPAMDRLFADSAGARRRFLDRLVLAMEPAHARVSNRYDQAVRERNKLLSADGPMDTLWLDGLESAMAEAAASINANRCRMLAALSACLAEAPNGPFAIPNITLEGHPLQHACELQANWRQERVRDKAVGRTLSGPHRADLIVTHSGSGQAAASCSTGEQKALLLSTILAHAAVVTQLRGSAPLILLDEVAAHLDPIRREALFDRLAATGGQIWMTGTEAGLFGGISWDAQFISVENGAIEF